MNKEKIKAKVLLNIPLTQKEKAIYLLFIATIEQAKEYLKREVKNNGRN